MSVPTLAQAITAFNQREFYACHDILEAIWLEAEPTEKNFYQGILQIAVGCYHLQNHNWQGAVTLLGEGIRRLQTFQPQHQGVQITALMKQSFALLTALQAIVPEQVGEFWEQQVVPGKQPLPRLTLVVGLER
jgi:hypothetical protein